MVKIDFSCEKSAPCVTTEFYFSTLIYLTEKDTLILAVFQLLYCKLATSLGVDPQEFVVRMLVQLNLV